MQDALETTYDHWKEVEGIYKTMLVEVTELLTRSEQYHPLHPDSYGLFLRSKTYAYNPDEWGALPTWFVEDIAFFELQEQAYQLPRMIKFVEKRAKEAFQDAKEKAKEKAKGGSRW